MRGRGDPAGPIPSRKSAEMLDFSAILPPATLAQATAVIAPVAILALCVVAGIGTTLLLPSRTLEPSIRRIGGAVVLLAFGILAGILARQAAFTVGLGVYFWVFSAIAIFASIRVVTHPRPVYSALYFVLTVFATAGLLVLLWAEFMAAAVVLIYAGAILVTYLFVIMLAAGSVSDRAAEMTSEADLVSREPLVASALGFALMGLLLLVIFDRAGGMPPAQLPQPVEIGTRPGVYVPTGSTQRLGVELFRNHMLSLELAGLILTLGMVGAIVIARRRILLSADRQAEDLSAMDAMSTGEDNPHAIPIHGTDNPRQKAYPQT